MARGGKVLYLDESGDHSLEKIDPTYPLFVLGGVILDRTYARTVVVPRLETLKAEFFDRSDLILHTSDIVRARNGFESLQDATHRAALPDHGSTQKSTHGGETHSVGNA